MKAVALSLSTDPRAGTDIRKRLNALILLTHVGKRIKPGEEAERGRGRPGIGLDF
jgi:hypothetical protein